MGYERRYSAEEVEQILDQAARRSVAPDPAPEGDLTLLELQAIGKEVGIAPQYVARAAADLDRVTRTRHRFGLPLELSRTVELPREPTPREWDRLVADLRQTFRATGKVRRDESLRQWRNGNLVVAVEPSGAGVRLRMETRKGSARQLTAGGGVLLAVALVVLATGMAPGGPADPGLLVPVSVLAALGAGMLGGGLLPLPSWAAERREQFEEVEARFRASLAPEASEIHRPA